jgi:peptide/nickel transport system substrate-binding protein
MHGFSIIVRLWENDFRRTSYWEELMPKSNELRNSMDRRSFNLLLMGGASALATTSAMPAFAQASGGTLTAAFSTPPISMNPALNGGGINEAFLDPAYQPLIMIDAQGNETPGLAASYGYVGDDNTVFEITLREGLVFADGTPLDAQACKTYMDYYKVAGGPGGRTMGTLGGVEVIDALTFCVTMTVPTPNMVNKFTQNGLWGSVANPTRIANDPESLGNTTDGCGQYVLDAAATVSGSEYVYTPNPHYYDQSHIKWNKIVIRVIDNTNSRVQALAAGQIDYTQLDAQTAPAAQAAGANVAFSSDSFAGLYLLDRNNSVSPEMQDVRVRQAMNYALDRETIVKALFDGYAEPTTQITVPGRAGFVAELDSYYDYNPDKARALLAEAGVGEFAIRGCSTDTLFLLSHYSSLLPIS